MTLSLETDQVKDLKYRRYVEKGLKYGRTLSLEEQIVFQNLNYRRTLSEERH